MDNKIVTLTTDVDYPLLHADRDTRRVLEVVVTAYQPTYTAKRQPINCALVIDRSGSMGAENKLGYAQQAARYFIDHLNEGDSVALVVYDNTVNVLVPHSPLTARTRHELHAAVNNLSPGNSTDLHGGWLRGTQQVANALLMPGVNRVLLLSDGLANHGLTNIEQILSQAQQVRKASIATSTFGVGYDYNEWLLRPMAEQGGGHYYFIEAPGQIPAIFQREFGEMATVVAQRAEITVTVPAGTQLMLRGDLPHEQHDSGIVHALGDLSAGEERRFYFRVITPAAANSSTVVIGTKVVYDDQDGRQQEESVEAVYTYSHPFQDAPRNRAVLTRYAQIALAATANRALRLQREGRAEEAATMLLSDLKYYQKSLDEEDQSKYRELAQQIRRGISERERKVADYANYRARQSRR
jgi:Ca-activated chloride channel homolog